MPKKHTIYHVPKKKLILYFQHNTRMWGIHRIVFESEKKLVKHPLIILIKVS